MPAENPRDDEVHRFSFPVMGGRVEIRIRRVDDNKFRCVGVLVVSEYLKVRFRGVGDFAVEITDPTGIVGQVMGAWPQVVAFLRTAQGVIGGGAK